ncbi:MAG: hypothetical protein ACKOAH_08235, partial [Pirellula sp.]
WLWNEPMPVHSTFEHWLGQQLPVRSSVSPSMAQGFIRIVQQMAYAPAQMRRLDTHQERLIGQVLRSIIFSGLKTAAVPRVNPQTKIKQPQDRQGKQ